MGLRICMRHYSVRSICRQRGQGMGREVGGSEGNTINQRRGRSLEDMANSEFFCFTIQGLGDWRACVLSCPIFVHGILQARILEWVAISYSWGSSQPRDQTCISCTDREILHHWAIWEATWGLDISKIFVSKNIAPNLLAHPHTAERQIMPHCTWRPTLTGCPGLSSNWWRNHPTSCPTWQGHISNFLLIYLKSTVFELTLDCNRSEL